MGAISKAIKQMEREKAKERLIQEEKKLINEFQEEGKVEAKGVTQAINDLRVTLAADKNKTEVLVANGTTGIALRRQFANDERVQVIITGAAETGTVYQVVDEGLRTQLLAAMGERW